MKTVTVATDQITNEISQMFDYSFDGITTFEPPKMPKLPEEFGIGLIVGPSGSGKTTLLETFGNPIAPIWHADKAICSHFATASEAQDRLSAVGFNSIPSWMRPYHVLSTGEKFRADLARQLVDGALIDEFTSVIDRNVARACSVAIRRYVDKNQLRNLVFASCHYDILEWLNPDWVFDTVTGQLELRGLRSRPSITLELVPCSTRAWKAFSEHHYLDGNVNRSSRCWLAFWDGTAVGFAAALPFPSGSFKNAWRGHRTVVAPDFQGMGFGVRISDAVAQIFVEQGCRYFSKTAHPRMGLYREKSPLWKPTSKNRKSRPDYKSGRKTKEHKHKHKHINRLCFSHEFIGKTVDQ